MGWGEHLWGPREETGGQGLSPQEWAPGCWHGGSWEQLQRPVVLGQPSGTEFHQAGRRVPVSWLRFGTGPRGA